MSKIKKFEFKNIRSYGNKMVSIPFDMDNGLVLISGKNGGGKTSIVEALEFAIYGKSSRVPVKDLPNWINDNAFTTVEFETNDNRLVQLSRGISPDFYDLKVGGSAYSSKTKTENKAGKNKIDKMVEDELFGLAQDIFANNVLLSVQDFKSFIKMKAADKRKIIDKIFDTDIFNDMLVKLKSELSDLKKKQSELSLFINSKQSTLDTTNARIDEIKSTISDDIDAVITKYQNKIDEINAEISFKSDLFQKMSGDLDTLKNEYDSLIQSYNQKLFSAMNDYNIAVSKIDSEYNSNIESYLKMHNEKMHDELSKIDFDKQSEVSLVPSVDSVIKSRVDELNDKLVKISEVLSTFCADADAKMNSMILSLKNDAQSRKDSLKSEYESTRDVLLKNKQSIFDSISKNESKVASNASTMTELYGKISVISNKLKLYQNDKCPECGADLNDSYHTNEKNALVENLNSIRGQYSALNHENDSINVNISKMKTEIDGIDKSISDLDKQYHDNVSDVELNCVSKCNEIQNKHDVEISSMVSKADGAKKQIVTEISDMKKTATDEYNNKVAEIENRYNSMVNMTRSKYNDAYSLFESAQKNDMDAKKTDKKSAYDDIVSELNQKREEYDAKYAPEIDKSKNELKSMSEVIESLRERLNDTRLNLVAVQNGDSTKTLNELSIIAKELIDDIESTRPELEECEHKIKIRENTQSLIGENGLKRMIMRNILPQFNASIQRITSMFDFKYRFIFDDNFDAHLSYCGKEVPITVSRGEEKIMDIIVILSTLQLILLKHPNINMLFLDEIFSNLDVENIAKAVSILKDYSKKYNLIVFVMSHTTVPVELFDKTINISFDGSFSSLEIN